MIAHETQSESMVQLEGLCARLGDFELQDISLQIRRGEYVVILGPTGTGKTVLLECIAGLVSAQSGCIHLAGRDVTGLPPEQRRIGYLPQDFGLFPHLDVYRNLVFGLKIRKAMDRAAEAIPRLTSMLGIEHLLRRDVSTLSGGEKQRVALGRALAIDPDLMLLDEPLSAVDAATRDRIGNDLLAIHRAQGMTSIHVCHNFEETVRLADRVALMHNGRLVQVGTPGEIIRHPNCLFAAEFVRSENILPGYARAHNHGAQVDLDGIEVTSDTGLRGPVYAAIRPDEIRLLDAADTNVGDDENTLTALVTKTEDRGYGYAVQTQGGIDLTALVPRRRWQELGDCRGRTMRLTFPARSVHAFPRAAGDEPPHQGHQTRARTHQPGDAS